MFFPTLFQTKKDLDSQKQLLESIDKEKVISEQVTKLFSKKKILKKKNKTTMKHR